MTTQFSIISDNSVIKGTITHSSAFDLTVRVDHPYSGYTASRHIPYFARHAYSFTGIYGEQVQTALLEGLYEALRTLQNTNESLYSGIDSAYKRIQRLSDTYDEIDRVNLRALFKIGEISQSEYQSILKQYRNDRHDIDQKIHGIKLSTIEEIAPSTIGLISIEQAFDFLANRLRE